MKLNSKKEVIERKRISKGILAKLAKEGKIAPPIGALWFYTKPTEPYSVLFEIYDPELDAIVPLAVTKRPESRDKYDKIFEGVFLGDGKKYRKQKRMKWPMPW